MRPSVPNSTAFDRWNACAARVSPTVNTATPDVAEPIIAKQLASSFGMRRPTNTTTIPNTGAQRSGDFNPDLSPDTTCARWDDAAEGVLVPELPISRRTMAVGTTRLMARATRPTVPALVSPTKGWSTPIPKTGSCAPTSPPTFMNDPLSVLAFSLELHPCSESEDNGAIPASTHVGVILDHGLQEEHR